MADRIVTPEAAAAHVAEHCPHKVDVTRIGQTEREHLCGCGHCPAPDPTPEQLQQRIDEAIWQSSQHALEEARGPYMPLSGRYLNAGAYRDLARRMRTDQNGGAHG